MKLARHKITFESVEDIEAVALGQLGFSNKFIEASTHLTQHQITYRLTKAKNAEGLKKGEGYRSAWRNGTSKIAQDIQTKMLPGLRSKVAKTLPQHFTHPTPEVVKREAA